MVRQERMCATCISFPQNLMMSVIGIDVMCMCCARYGRTTTRQLGNPACITQTLSNISNVANDKDSQVANGPIQLLLTYCASIFFER